MKKMNEAIGDIEYVSAVTADEVLSGMMDNCSDELIDKTVAFFYKIAKKLNTRLEDLLTLQPSESEYMYISGPEVKFEDENVIKDGDIKDKNFNASVFHCGDINFVAERLDNGQVWLYFANEGDFDKFKEMAYEDEFSDAFSDTEEIGQTIRETKQALSESAVNIFSDMRKEYTEGKLKYYKEFPNANVPFDDAIKMFRASDAGDKNWLLKPLHNEEAWN